MWCAHILLHYTNHCQIISSSELNSLWSPNIFAEGFVSNKIPSCTNNIIFDLVRDKLLYKVTLPTQLDMKCFYLKMFSKSSALHVFFFTLLHCNNHPKLPACIDMFGVREQKFWSLFICLHLLSLTSSFQPNHPPNLPPTSCILSSIFLLPPVIFVFLSSPRLLFSPPLSVYSRL